MQGIPETIAPHKARPGPGAPSNGAGPADPIIPQDAVTFFGALFAPDDWVLLRPVETWTENGKKQSRVLNKQVTYLKTKDLKTARDW